MKIKNKTKILVIGGPTGVGESTITRAVIDKYPNFKRLVTATTRKSRLNERDKVDYYFFTVDRFKAEIKRGNIIEYTYIKKRDVYYGSYKPDLDKKLQAGFDIIVNPDLVGAKYYKKYYQAVTIFIMPDSLVSLRRRQLKRNPQINSDELNKRLEYAQYEMEHEADFYDYVVVNKENQLQQAIKEVLEIIEEVIYK